MQDFEKYLEEDFIIYNNKLGVRDFVSIGKIETYSNISSAWLESPYEMVGPFSLDELIITGKISFEQCVVMSEAKWEEEQILLQKEAFLNQRRRQEEFQDEIYKHNKKRANVLFGNEKEHRQILCLPIEGNLEENQIKTAYKIVVKKVHPDVGGSHEKFIQVTKAKDTLLENIV